ncbi:xanthine dehydrogenase accessory factor [uncultured Gammaproteobacteria bacterium]
MRRSLLDRLNRARAEREPVALVIDLAMGLETLVFLSAVHGGFGLDQPELDQARQMLGEGRTGIVETIDETRLLVRPFLPPPRLVVVGAVHITQSLVRLAAEVGLEPVVIDPRGVFATAERFPGVTLSQEWPDQGLGELKPDARTAVVALSHDPKLDDSALVVALRSPAFYIGALGSRRSQAKRLERLREQGVGEADLARIRGPVGLDLGAVTASEIALAIVAEVVASLRGRLPGLGTVSPLCGLGKQGENRT